MKLKFLTIKKAHCASILVILVAICSIVGICYAIKATSSPKALYTIVIDAGHGGVDVKLGQYVFSKKTTYFLDMWLFLIYKHHYRLYTSGLLQIHL